MLKLVPTNTFAATVSVRLPTDNPNVDCEGDFVARFKYLKAAAFQAVQRDMADLVQTLMRASSVVADEDTVAPSFADLTYYRRKLLSDVLVSVEGIADENGEPYPAAKQIEIVNDSVALLNAVSEAFFASYQKAPTKNSKTSRKR